VVAGGKRRIVLNKLLADVLVDQKNREIVRNELRRRALAEANRRGDETDERSQRSRLRRLVMDRLPSRF
jgi:hypothetical protein